MVEFQVERTIAASPERVFDWLADPANLTAAPVILKVRWVKVGALREAIGLGGWFRGKIPAPDRPRAYSYRLVRSIPPFDPEGCTLTFTPSRFCPPRRCPTHSQHPTLVRGQLV